MAKHGALGCNGADFPREPLALGAALENLAVLSRANGIVKLFKGAWGEA